MQELYEHYRRTDQPGVFYPSSLLILSLSIRLLRIKGTLIQIWKFPYKFVFI